jgi:hypothetical protein
LKYKKAMTDKSSQQPNKISINFLVVSFPHFIRKNKTRKKEKGDLNILKPNICRTLGNMSKDCTRKTHDLVLCIFF